MYSRAIQDRLPTIQDQMEEAATKAGRSVDEVKLIAVTKGHPPEAISAAIEHGLTEIGENRVESLEQKVPLFQENRPTWHMIGHLQRRKAKSAVQLADMIHSIDSIQLAERVNRMAIEMEKRVSVLIQVNASGEATKGGFIPEETQEAAERIAALGQVAPVGLMTMAPFTTDEHVIRQTFAVLRRTGEGLSHLPGLASPELSMGMSNDFSIAIEEGSTMIRLGTALLGARPA